MSSSASSGLTTRKNIAPNVTPWLYSVAPPELKPRNIIAHGTLSNRRHEQAVPTKQVPTRNCPPKLGFHIDNLVCKKLLYRIVRGEWISRFLQRRSLCYLNAEECNVKLEAET